MRVAAIVVALAVVAVLLWRTTTSDNDASPTAATRDVPQPPTPQKPTDKTERSANVLKNRPLAREQVDRDHRRPSLGARPAAAYAAIEATPEEIEAIEAIEAESRQSLARIPEDLVGDDRVNAVIEAEQDKLEKLARLLGDRRANWYLKLRADELEPEVNRLLMPPADDAGVAAPSGQD